MEINHQKADRIKKLGNFDISLIRKRLLSLNNDEWNAEEDFKLNYNKNNKALNQVKHLTLRFIDRQKETYDYLESPRWQQWKTLLFPLMKEIVTTYRYKNPVFPKVMFANLPSGSFIPPHIDGDKSGYIPHKIHLPILTNKQSYFFLENKRYHFETGMAYEVNNGLSHAVANKGVTDRIHLIFECLDYDIQPKSTQNKMKRLR
ncbi:MAG: aspartyl/asparaginyl beta-hydroxylase domain-containing protein [Vicingaceae bacterium]